MKLFQTAHTIEGTAFSIYEVETDEIDYVGGQYVLIQGKLSDRFPNTIQYNGNLPIGDLSRAMKLYNHERAFRTYGEAMYYALMVASAEALSEYIKIIEGISKSAELRYPNSDQKMSSEWLGADVVKAVRRQYL